MPRHVHDRDRDDPVRRGAAGRASCRCQALGVLGLGGAARGPRRRDPRARSAWRPGWPATSSSHWSSRSSERRAAQRLGEDVPRARSTPVGAELAPRSSSAASRYFSTYGSSTSSWPWRMEGERDRCAASRSVRRRGSSARSFHASRLGLGGRARGPGGGGVLLAGDRVVARRAPRRSGPRRRAGPGQADQQRPAQVGVDRRARRDERAVEQPVEVGQRLRRCARPRRRRGRRTAGGRCPARRPSAARAAPVSQRRAQLGAVRGCGVEVDRPSRRSPGSRGRRTRRSRSPMFASTRVTKSVARHLGVAGHVPRRAPAQRPGQRVVERSRGR